MNSTLKKAPAFLVKPRASIEVRLAGLKLRRPCKTARAKRAEKTESQTRQPALPWRPEKPVYKVGFQTIQELRKEFTKRKY